MSRPITLLLALPALMFAVAGQAGEALKKELARLEGTWDLVPPEGTKEAMQLKFAAGKLTVIFVGMGSLEADIKVYPETNPRCIDLDFKKGRQETYEGIYAIEGDTLRLALGQANLKDRPTKFPEDADPSKYAVFKRQKP